MPFLWTRISSLIQLLTTIFLCYTCTVHVHVYMYVINTFITFLRFDCWARTPGSVQETCIKRHTVFHHWNETDVHVQYNIKDWIQLHVHCICTMSCIELQLNSVLRNIYIHVYMYMYIYVYTYTVNSDVYVYCMYKK